MFLNQDRRGHQYSRECCEFTVKIKSTVVMQVLWAAALAMQSIATSCSGDIRRIYSRVQRTVRGASLRASCKTEQPWRGDLCSFFCSILKQNEALEPTVFLFHGHLASNAIKLVNIIHKPVIHTISWKANSKIKKQCASWWDADCFGFLTENISVM